MKYPWVPVLIAFATGILLPPCPPDQELALIVFAGLSLLIAAILLFTKNKISSYIAVVIAFIIIGNLLISRQVNFETPDHFSNLVTSGKIKLNQHTEVIGEITQHPERGRDSLLLTIGLRQVSQGKITYYCRGKITLFVKLSSDWATNFFHCPEGSNIRFVTRLKKPPGFNNPGCMDFPALLRQKQILFTSSVNSPLAIQFLENKNGLSPVQILSNLRSFLEESIFNHFSDSLGMTTKGAFINALILGNRGYLDDADIGPLKRAGLMHITAISGFHIWIIGLLVFVSLRYLKLQDRWVTAITIMVMIFYWSISGGRSSTTRAVIVAIIFLSSRLISRKTWFFNNLAFAALLILIFNPVDIFNPGFQLTFAAVIAIATCYKRILRNLETLKWAAPPLAASLSAQLGVLPLVVWHFNIINLHSALSSLIIIPFATMAIFFSFVFLLVAQFIPFISDIFGGLLSLSFGMFIEVANFADSAFPFSIRLPSPPVWLILVYYLLLASWMVIDKKTFDKNDYSSRWIYASGLTFLVLAVGLIIINPTAIPGKGNYSLSAIDVGQADSWFFQLPDGKGVLIDGGGNPLGDFDVGEHIVSPVLWHLGYRKLEAVIATHADSDHMEGLIAVVKNFEIKELWVNFPEEKPLLLKKLLRIAEKRGVKIVGVKEKFARKIGEACFQFLSPPQSPFRGKDAANNNSAIIKVSFLQGSFLIPGDSEIPALKRVSSKYGNILHSRILTLPHHGSRDALLPEFLSKVKPEYCLAGVGKNNVFGFPHKEVTAQLAGMKLPLLRTDELGFISMKFEDAQILIKTGRELKPYTILPDNANQIPVLFDSKKNMIPKR